MNKKNDRIRLYLFNHNLFYIFSFHHKMNVFQKKSYHYLLMFLSFIYYSFSFQLQSQEFMYKWLDKNGKIHFSELPPKKKIIKKWIK
jgi:hypothetical protein